MWFIETYRDCGEVIQVEPEARDLELLQSLSLSLSYLVVYVGF